MEYWTNYTGHAPQPYVFIDKRGRPHLDDMNIYTFDIETTSYFITKDGRVHSTLLYSAMNADITAVGAFMYIWQLGINDRVYYGRTAAELTEFLTLIHRHVPATKYFFVHNLSFEFQFLKSFIDFERVFARKRRKPMRAETTRYNIIWRCSYHLANSSLEALADNYDLPVQKQTGKLDYYRLRNSKTILSDEELKYCEYDCLVLYHYINKELNRYGDFRNLPLTATGKVRKSFKEAVSTDPDYLHNVRAQYDTDPNVYDALMSAYCGGYCHANTYLRGEILLHVRSYDFTSSYPYVLLTEKYPCSKFTPARIARYEDMRLEDHSYLVYARFENIESKLDNPIIPVYKIKHGKNVCNDNGRLESADYIEIWLTDYDFRMIYENYEFDKNYKILKSYSARKDYLPRPYLLFILNRYKIKTIYKNVPSAADKYRIAKSDLNSLYGMAVTNLVCPKIVYENGVWLPPQPVNVRSTLIKLQREAYMSPAWGVFCTAAARFNLISIMRQLDEYWIYSDTDSGKITEDAPISAIEDYNKNVYNKIKKVCEARNLDPADFSPADIDGKIHTLGLFDYEGTYSKFKTMGSKKYSGIKKCRLEITIAGVAKNEGAAWLTRIENFEPQTFPGIITGKMTSLYCDEQKPVMITDYQGNEEEVTALTGLALMPCDYTLKYSKTDALAPNAEFEILDAPTEGRQLYNGN